jgi:hypothetical protein
MAKGLYLKSYGTIPHSPITVSRASPLVEVRTVVGKGQGVFALCDIPRGTRIIAESALLKIGKEGASFTHKVVRAFNSLPASQQKSYLQLHAFACDALKRMTKDQMGRDWSTLTHMQRKVLAVYQTNNFGDSVVLLGSRINHSCIPNTEAAYSLELDKETFNAVRDIAAGEELTLSYIHGVNLAKSERQKLLKKWGFTCTCLACTDTSEERQRESEGDGDYSRALDA